MFGHKKGLSFDDISVTTRAEFLLYLGFQKPTVGNVMGKVIGFITEKGGASKTSASTTFAYWLTIQYPGAEVALVDACTAHHATKWGLDRIESRFPKVFHQARLDNISIGAEIKKLQEKYDYVVIDGRPALDAITKSIVDVCDAIVIPLQPSKPDVESASMTANYLQTVPKKPTMKAAFLLTAWESGTTNGAMLKGGVEQLGFPIIDAVIEHRTAWRGSLSVGSTVHEMEPKSVAAKEAHTAFCKIMEELL